MEVIDVIKRVSDDLRDLPFIVHARVRNVDISVEDNGRVIDGGTVYLYVELNDNGNGMEDTRDCVADAIESLGYASVFVYADLEFDGDSVVIYGVDYMEALQIAQGGEENN